MQQLSLLELNNLIKKTLETSLEPSFWVIAEIGEMRVNQRGHCYLELVEKEGEKITAKGKAIIWASLYRNLSTWFQSMTNYPLQQGMKILANVVVQFHEIYGFNLIIKDIDPNFTIGERAKIRREVIEKLIREGVFEMNQDLELPIVPQKLAVISSPTAAGYEDFIQQLQLNTYGYQFEVRLFKALMQGQEAQESILAAIHRVFNLAEVFDALIIIRGGGSQLDLDSFDSYELCSHLAQFPLPVITGIGHQRDEAVADLVAHTNLKTPTAVSEFLIQRVREFDMKLDQLYHSLSKNSISLIREHRIFLENAFANIGFRVKDQLRNSQNQLQRWLGKIQFTVAQKTAMQVSKIENLHQRLQKAPLAFLEIHRRQLHHMEQSVYHLDPSKILKRGFTISTINGTLLKNIKTLNVGETLITKTHQKVVKSTIRDFKNKP